MKGNSYIKLSEQFRKILSKTELDYYKEYSEFQNNVDYLIQQATQKILDKIEKIGLKYFLDKPTDKTTFFTILKKDWKKLKQEAKDGK